MVVRPVVEVFASAAYRSGRAGLGVVVRAGGRIVQVIRRAVQAGSPAEAAYRAIVLGLWHARSAGTRNLRVRADHPDVVDQVTGEVDPPAELIGVYLQVRALMNAYRWSRLELIPRESNVEAALAAVEALDGEPLMDDTEDPLAEALPLFTS